MGLVIAIPSPQGGVAVICKQRIQRRSFEVTVTKHNLGLSPMPRINPARAAQDILSARSPPQAHRAIHYYPTIASESIRDGHHAARASDL
jgi:hypothetical protein